MLRNGLYTTDAWRLTEKLASRTPPAIHAKVTTSSGELGLQSPAVCGESSKPERANFAGTVPRGSADIYI